MLFKCQKISEKIFKLPEKINKNKIGAITINGVAYNLRNVEIKDNKIFLNTSFEIEQLFIFENRNFDSLYVLNKHLQKEVVTNVYKTQI